jgi:hypothetical protein
VLDWSFEIFGEFPEGLRRISRNFAVYSAANSEMVKTQCPSGNTLFYYSALWFGFSGPPRSLAHGFAEEVAWNVEQGGTPFVRPCGIVKSLDGNLDDLVTRVHFDPDLSVAEFDLVAPTVFATDYRMGHLFSSIFQWVNPAVLAWTRTFVLPWRDIVVVPSQSRLDVQTKGCAACEALSLGTASVASYHVGLGHGLVQEDQAFGIKTVLFSLPLLPGGGHIRPFLFLGENGFFIGDLVPVIEPPQAVDAALAITLGDQAVPDLLQRQVTPRATRPSATARSMPSLPWAS